MEFIINFPLFTIILSFVGVVMASVFNRKVSRVINLCIEGIALVLTVCVLIYSLNKGTSTNYSMGHFPAPYDNEIRFGVLEGILGIFAISLISLSLIAGDKYIDEDISEKKQKYIYVLLNLVQVALISLIYTNDIFTGYVFLEISTLSSIGLVALKEKGNATLAAIRYMIFNLLGSGLFLIGCVLLYDMTGYLSMEYILAYIKEMFASSSSSAPLVLVCIGLIGIGLGIKSGMFPFYFWMSDTYTEGTLTSSMVVSGLISKAYIILLIKFVYRVFGMEILMSSGMNLLFSTLGILGMIFGSLSALTQSHLKKMVAFSSAAQIGYIYMGIGLGAIGMTGAVFQLITHGITKAMLFAACQGLTDASGGKDDFKSIQGAGKRNITAGVVFTCGALSMVGIPLFAGFITKYLFVEAAINYPSTMVYVLGALVISTLLNIAYYLRTMIVIYLPSEESGGEKVPFIKNKRINLAMIAFLIINLSLGLIPYINQLITTGLSMF